MNEKCKEPALFRYTWPGQDESYICLDHALKLDNVANSIGLYLQLIQLSTNELIEGKLCMQNIKGK